jgi:hypothetical protein
MIYLAIKLIDSKIIALFYYCEEYNYVISYKPDDILFSIITESLKIVFIFVLCNRNACISLKS